MLKGQKRPNPKLKFNNKGRIAPFHDDVLRLADSMNPAWECETDMHLLK